ncbi:MAG: ATP-dependent Clp protease proteolytic subunit [Mogibacterium sp.]|nr:ATP-dependent Clp protease proteolytic subunit [Mogibacterium sp.]
MANSIFEKPGILKESSSGYTHVKIEEELMLTREIFVISPVDADTMSALFMQVLYLYREDPDKEITIYINSPGGEVQSGMAVVDLLGMIGTPVRTVCIGTAASMGAMLFLAGDKREMMPSSRLMIHDPSLSGGSFDGKKPAEIEAELERLKETQEMIGKMIAEKTGKSIEEVLKITARDTYFSPEEAIEFGLATGVVTKI